MHNYINKIKNNFDTIYIIHHYSFELFNSGYLKLLLNFIDEKIYSRFVSEYNKQNDFEYSINSIKNYINSIIKKFYYIEYKLGSKEFFKRLKNNLVKNLIIKEKKIINIFLDNIFNELFNKKCVKNYHKFLFSNEIVDIFYIKYFNYLEKFCGDNWEEKYHHIKSFVVLPSLKDDINNINNNFFNREIKNDIDNNFIKFINNKKKINITLTFNNQIIINKIYKFLLRIKYDTQSKKKINTIILINNCKKIIQKNNLEFAIIINNILNNFINSFLCNQDIIYLINIIYDNNVIDLYIFLINSKLLIDFINNLEKFICNKIIYNFEKNKCLRFINFLEKKYKFNINKIKKILDTHKYLKTNNGTINIINSLWDSSFCGNNQMKNIELGFIKLDNRLIINYERSRINITIYNDNNSLDLCVNVIQYLILKCLINKGELKEYDLILEINITNNILVKNNIDKLIDLKILKKYENYKINLNNNLNNKLLKGKEITNNCKNKINFQNIISKEKLIQAILLKILKKKRILEKKNLLLLVLNLLKTKININESIIINQLNILYKKELIDIDNNIIKFI